MKAIALTTLAAAAGLATANPFVATGLTDYTVDNAGVATSSMVIDISGYQSNDAYGSPLNQVLSVFLGVGAEITGISYDVTLTTTGASWASESKLDFEGQIWLTPGFSDSFSVSNMNYNSGGIVDMTDNGLPNIVLSGDGILDIEFFEGFTDNGGAGDGFWQAGSTVTVYGTGIVPTPGSLAVLGLGGLVAGRRRR